MPTDPIFLPQAGAKTVRWTYLVDGKPMQYAGYGAVLDVREDDGTLLVHLGTDNDRIMFEVDEDPDSEYEHTGAIEATFTETDVAKLPLLERRDADLLLIPPTDPPEWLLSCPVTVLQTISRRVS